MRSIQVPHEQPVLRLPGTDNSVHLRVARQPRMPDDMANPAGLHYCTSRDTLRVDGRARWGHLLLLRTCIKLTVSGAAERSCQVCTG